ncbi:reverse transcriptase domain-containing protein [Tanacetum coccineum]
MSKKSSWDNNRGHKNKDRFSPYRGPNHGLLPSMSKSPKEILSIEKAARSFEPPPKMFGMKGIKKERTKSSDTPRGEIKKDKGTALAEAPILMVSREAHIAKSLAQENTDYGGKEIIFPPVAKVNNTLVIINAKIFGRKVGRVYMDSGSSCEMIYEHCFEKLNPTIKATKVDLKTPLVGFSGECSWYIGEVLLEITIGDTLLSRTETLNFVIVRSDSSHNMLLGRTTMQRMGIVVSMIHGAIKFHTKKGIRTVLSADETNEGTKRARKILATNEERVLSCVNAEQKIIVNDKYPNQTVTIRKQLPEHFKKELQNLLKSNADVFVWTHAEMTGIPRTIMVEGKPFNTEHKVNEYSHVKPIKWNKRGLGPACNVVACKETEELMKEGILRKVKNQTSVANPVMKIESLLGFRLKYFLDAYKGYHQIQIEEEDEDKTTFYAGEGVVCYKKIPSGLKNAGETYQRNEKQTPANFLVEIPFEDHEKKEKLQGLYECQDSNSKLDGSTLTDASSTKSGSGARLLFDRS